MIFKESVRVADKPEGFQRRTWEGRKTQTKPVVSRQRPNVHPPLMWLIVAVPAQHRGTVLPMPSGSVIGRQGDVRWHDARMSRKHAQIDLVTNDMGHPAFILTPLNDRNGTLVNDQPITEATIIQENDVIEMGDTQFVVKVLK